MSNREHIHQPTKIGDIAADYITGFVGSWPFIGIHAAWFITWIVAGVEPFPYGLLTLLVSLEAIFLSTFVMMSQNRAAAKDHVRDDLESHEVEVMFQQRQQLYKINQRQLKILQLLKAHLDEQHTGDQGEHNASLDHEGNNVARGHEEE